MAELAATLAATEGDRLDQAEALVRTFCGWHIAPSRTETVVARASDASRLLVRSLYVTAVSAVTVDGEAVPTTDYAWTTAGVFLRSVGYWPAGDVSIDLTHGYPEVPREVEAIVQAVAQRAVLNPGSKPREQNGPFADTYSQSGFNQAPALALLDAEKATLRPYVARPRP